jgi:hypothetical protein
MPKRAPVDWSLWTFGDDRLITPNGRTEWLVDELLSRPFNDAENIHYLSGEWSGWRTRGRFLMSPDRKRVIPLQIKHWLLSGGHCVDCAHRPRTDDEERQLSLPF